MTLLFAESFDGMDKDGFLSKFNVAGGTAWGITFPAGVTGNCVYLDAPNGTASAITAPLNTSNATIIAGFDILVPSAFANVYLFSGSAKSANHDFGLFTSTNSTLVTVYTGGVSRGTYNMTKAAWVNIEVKVFKHATAGTIEVRENGVAVFSQTGIDTELIAGDIKAVEFHCEQLDEISVDNFYICDGAGSANNDFLDQVKIETLYPDSDGDFSDFLGSDADKIDNWELVNDVTPDGDATFVKSSTVGEKDLYNYQPTTFVGNIKGCILSTFAKLDPSGNKEFSHLAKIGGIEYEGSNKLLFDNSYQLLEQVYEEDPDTVAPWTQSGINAAQFGLKVKI